jgi:hypothetical protein
MSHVIRIPLIGMRRLCSSFLVAFSLLVRHAVMAGFTLNGTPVLYRNLSGETKENDERPYSD